MKILFFVDTHEFERLKHIKNKAKKVDMLVCAGDFTIFEHDMEKALHELDSIGKPVIMIHGNHETASSVMLGCERHKNLRFIHKKHHIIDDLVFFGFGGGGFSTRDEAFTKEAEKFIKELEETEKKDKRAYRLILVTHAPPFGTKVDDLGGHVGNQNITEFIIKHQPIIAVCGHIHECSGEEDKINMTRVMNPGWDGIIVEL